MSSLLLGVFVALASLGVVTLLPAVLVVAALRALQAPAERCHALAGARVSRAKPGHQLSF